MIDLDNRPLRSAVLVVRQALNDLYDLTEGTELAVGTEDILDPFDSFADQFKFTDEELAR